MTKSNSKTKESIFETARGKAHDEATNMLASQSEKVTAWLVEKYGMELAAQQIGLESEGIRSGIDKFYDRLEAKLDRNEASEAAPFKTMVAQACEKLAAHLDEWLTYQRDKVRRKNKAFTLLDGQDTHKLSHVAISAVLNAYAVTSIVKGDMFILDSAVNTMGRAVEDEIRFGTIRDNEEANYYKMVKPQLDKRIGHGYKKAMMSRVEEDLANRKLMETWDKWTHDEAYRVGLILLDIISKTMGLFTATNVYVKGKATAETISLTLNESWEIALMNTSANNALMSAVRLPTVIPPKAWTSPIGGGYYMRGKKPARILRTHNKQAIERLFDVHMPNVYEAINLAQKSAWKVNTKVLDVAQAVYGMKHTKLSGVPQRDPLELPFKPEDINESEETLKLWKREAANTYRIEGIRKSKRMGLNMTLQSAEKFRNEPKIYFPCNMDWRGRVVAIPAFNPQGSGMCKGMLLSADTAPIGKEGIKWLAIHGASRAGNDKATLEVAEQWTYDNEQLILDIAANPLTNDYWQTVDEPFCFLAFCFEWAQVVEHGETYECGLPVSFDGSCSGIQHFSAMLRDEIGGAAVNLIPSATMSDIYGLVAGEVNKGLDKDILGGTATTRELFVDKKTEEEKYVTKYGTLELAQTWKLYGITREEAKSPTMTLPYGSGRFGFTDQIMDKTVQPAIDADNGAMFQNGVDTTKQHQACRYLATCMWDALGRTVTKAVEAMEWLQHVASLLSKEIKDKDKNVIRKRLPIFWTVPDGLPVWHEYRKDVTTSIDCVLYSGTRYRMSAVPTGEWEINAYKQRSGIAPNYVHSMDGCHLRMTVVHARRKYGIKFFHLIHDSFGTIPAHAGGLFKAVRETMVNMYEKHDVLEGFREQALTQLHESQVDSLKPVPVKGTLDLQGILQSEFCFR